MPDDEDDDEDGDDDDDDGDDDDSRGCGRGERVDTGKITVYWSNQLMF